MPLKLYRSPTEFIIANEATVTLTQDSEDLPYNSLCIEVETMDTDEGTVT